MSSPALARRVRAFDLRAIARALTLVESQHPEGRALIKTLYPFTGRALVVGITGAPGSGKSTLTDGLIHEFRKKKKRVGVVAVDPTSAFTGGALLGDRIRMQKHATDPGVYIRSMATRGEMGGLAPATLDAVDIFDAAGCDVVLIETVGVGQDEVEIIHAAHVVLVVLTPGMGDDVQAIKAGIMEIADIFVVNKADLAGADHLESRLRSLLSAPRLNDLPLFPGVEKHPGILRTIATKGEGLEALHRGILKKHKDTLKGGQAGLRERQRSAHRLRSILKAFLFSRLHKTVPSSVMARHHDQVAQRLKDPYSVAETLFKQLMKP